MKLKVISLWQPWAWAMAEGIKRNETRHWFTHYRGWIAIHAAKKPFKPIDYDPVFIGQLQRDGFELSDLAYGAVLCVANLYSVVGTEQIIGTVSNQEKMYGDYERGRFAWRTKDLIKLETPVPLVGHQGLFDWEVPEETAVQLRVAREEQKRLFEAV